MRASSRGLLNREQQQCLQWALKGFPEDQVEAECKRLNKAGEILKAERAKLETKSDISRDAAISTTKLEALIELIQGRNATADYETKRLALEGLSITVWLDGQNVEVTGVIEPECDIVHTSSE